MDIISDIITHLPLKKRTSSGGWLSFNGVCCHHRGHSPDKRGRGGIMLHDGGFSYSCFNCSFKTSWIPSKSLSENTKQFLSYLGFSDGEIQHINFEALKIKAASSSVITHKDYSITRHKKLDLPKNAKPLEYWLNNPTDDFLKCIDYMLERNKELLLWHDYYYSDTPQFKNRIIIPFYSNGEIVGYTARATNNDIKHVKYMTNYQDGYVFNADLLFEPTQKYIIMCEGVIDAITINGCACMKQTISESQKRLLKLCNKKIIIVPDRDHSGKNLVEQALELGYNVAFPAWQKGIKDCSDAVKQNGRLFTVDQILKSVEESPLKIKLKMRMWF